MQINFCTTAFVPMTNTSNTQISAPWGLFNFCIFLMGGYARGDFSRGGVIRGFTANM